MADAALELSNDDKNHHSTTSRRIAYGLVIIFALALGVTGIGALIGQGGIAKDWLELFKSGIMLLGGSLSSVVGYYFGSRGVQEAEHSAQITRQEAERISTELRLAQEETMTQKRLFEQMQKRSQDEFIDDDSAPTSEDDDTLEMPPAEENR